MFAADSAQVVIVMALWLLRGRLDRQKDGRGRDWMLSTGRINSGLSVELRPRHDPDWKQRRSGAELRALGKAKTPKQLRLWWMRMASLLLTRHGQRLWVVCAVAVNCRA